MGATKTVDEARRLPAHQLRRISVAAEVDPRTVARFIAGAPTKGLHRERVERALRDAGFAHLCAAGANHHG
jgi:hypothetical protein